MNLPLNNDPLNRPGRVKSIHRRPGVERIISSKGNLNFYNNAVYNQKGILLSDDPDVLQKMASEGMPIKRQWIEKIRVEKAKRDAIASRIVFEADPEHPVAAVSLKDTLMRALSQKTVPGSRAEHRGTYQVGRV